MSERILFLTGSLAEANLRQTLEQMQPTPFEYTVHPLGIKVAGLMTADMIRRRLPDAMGADRILVPGRCRGNLETVTEEFGVPVARGPEELKDLPRYFGAQAIAPDLNRRGTRIFAEIVEAPQLSIPAILERAAAYRRDGADIIDLGGLPDTPFPHLEEAVTALRAAGYRVSVDSQDADELLRGGRAGAEFLLSLTEHSVWIADQVAATPVLIPAEHGDLDSLERAMQALDARGRAYLVDPILDPLPYGFTDSLVRYHTLRARHPEAEILMGVGNITELTDADTAGINAVLFGVAAELGIANVLTTQVSPHARRAVLEADTAWRMMCAARDHQRLPRDLGLDLLDLHERYPFPYSEAEIRERAQQVRDPSYRIEISAAGIHLYNRDGLACATDPFALYPELRLDGDTGHAFYLGVEMARAEIGWQLGKRYTQDQPLRWHAVPEPPAATADYQAPGATLKSPARSAGDTPASEEETKS